MEDFYKVLKVSRDASWEEIEESYKELKSKYSEDRFLEGEEGRQGAVNLMELEKAYQELKKENEKKKRQEFFGNEYGDVDELIKANRLDEAQHALDAVVSRTARWHFLQSVLFYKRNWYGESKNQLQLAINLDPENQSYRDSMEKLEKVIASESFRPEEFQTQPPPPQMDSAMGIMNCCNALCCASLCCDLMRCL